MADITLGAPAQRVDVEIIRRSDQSFALELTDDQGQPQPPSGSVRLELADGTVWAGTTGGAGGNVVTWALTAAQTNLAYWSTSVAVVRVDGSARVVLGAGTLRCLPER